MSVLNTARLRLEPFQDSHVAGLNALNSDPRVMHFITGQPETWAETEQMVQRVKARWLEWGFSWWSFIERDSGELIGAGCIQYLGRDSANPLEVGWRLKPTRWGQGYASEAARTMTDFAFGPAQGTLLCAVCHPGNLRSARVMQRLGMHFRGTERWYEQENFVYEISAQEWQAQRRLVG